MQPDMKELEELADKIHGILCVLEVYCKHTDTTFEIQNIQHLIKIANLESGRLYCKIIAPSEY